MAETATSQDYNASVKVEELRIPITLSVELTDRIREEAIEETGKALADAGEILAAGITTQEQARDLASQAERASRYAEVVYQLTLAPEDD